jgi:hypothetical protein
VPIGTAVIVLLDGAEKSRLLCRRRTGMTSALQKQSPIPEIAPPVQMLIGTMDNRTTCEPAGTVTPTIV